MTEWNYDNYLKDRMEGEGFKVFCRDAESTLRAWKWGGRADGRKSGTPEQNSRGLNPSPTTCYFVGSWANTPFCHDSAQSLLKGFSEMFVMHLAAEC